VLCALFLASRGIVEGIKWVASIDGDDVAGQVEKGKSSFVGPEIAGKSLGVIGLGAIGVRVANAAVKLDMNVYGYDPYISIAAAWKLSRHAKYAQNLQTLYENCDYITLHLPMLDSTKGMINKDSIKSMKDGVRILNFARGELVNEKDIIDALNSGKVAKYITDFPTRGIVDAKNTVAVPHLGASTPESEENCANMAVAELMDYLANGNVKNSVNFPDVTLEQSGAFRLCLIHKNTQGELNNILSLLSAENVNVENMINKSKNEYAYTMIDLNTQVSEGVLVKVRNIKDMIRLRTINL
jgi:D-3-phosphoglycerate dehydrogenase